MNSNDLPLRAAVFRQVENADRSVSALIDAGFPPSAISVICPQCDAEGDVDPRVEQQEPAGANAPQAALTGGTIGAVLGGLTAAVGVVATGGTGLLVAGTLLGGGASGAVAGSFLGAMATRGFEPEIADFYDRALREGSILVAVEESSDGPALDQAEAVFEACGASPIPLTRG